MRGGEGRLDHGPRGGLAHALDRDPFDPLFLRPAGLAPEAVRLVHLRVALGLVADQVLAGHFAAGTGGNDVGQVDAKVPRDFAHGGLGQDPADESADGAAEGGALVDAVRGGRAFGLGDGLRADPDVVRLYRLGLRDGGGCRAGPGGRLRRGSGDPPAALDGVGLGSGTDQGTAGRAPGGFPGVGRVRFQLPVHGRLNRRRGGLDGGSGRGRGGAGGRCVTHTDNGRSDVDCHALLDQQLRDGSRKRGRQFDEGLGGLDLTDDVIDGHGVAGLDLPGDDFGLGQPLAHVGEVELMESHGVLDVGGVPVRGDSRKRSVGEGTVQCLEEAVNIREVVFLHLRHRIGHVEAADADDGRLE